MSLPSVSDTVNILNADRMALLPKGAYVINVGRGTAIDQDALIKALDSGHLAGAALDVVVPEPLLADHPLRKAKNLLLTPHVAGNMTLGYTCERNVHSSAKIWKITPRAARCITSSTAERAIESRRVPPLCGGRST